MTDDQHGEGTPRGRSRWDPLPQGEYDDGATAFVELPEGGVDALLAADSPLAAPGHGYVPPQIAVDPATTAGTDPAAPGAWPVPGAPVDGAQWHDPHAAHQQGRAAGEQPYGSEAAYGSGAPYGTDAGARPHGGNDRFAYNPGATGQWNFDEATAAEAAPGHDVTGQWSIPVAGGDLPDESGEFTTSSLVEQWGGTPPATLPGGAPAPWATQAAGRPWGQQDPAGQEQTGPGHPHGHGHEQPEAAGPASGYAPDPAGPLPQEADPAAGHAPQQPEGAGQGPELPGTGHARQPSDDAGQAPEQQTFADHESAPHGFTDGGSDSPAFADHGSEPSAFRDRGAESPAYTDNRPESSPYAEHGSDPHAFTDHGPERHGVPGHGPESHGVPGQGSESHGAPGHGADQSAFTDHGPEPSFTDHHPEPHAFTDHHGPEPHAPNDHHGHHGPEPHAFTDHHGPEPSGAPDHSPEPHGVPGPAPEPSGYVGEQTGRPGSAAEVPEHSEQPASPQPYPEAPGEAHGEPAPEAHAEPAVPPQTAQEASQGAPGPGEAAEDAAEAAEGADAPAEPSAGPLPAEVDADAGPEGADGETPDDPAPQDPPAGSADTEGEASQDAPATAPQEDHPLASYVLRVNGTDRPVTDAWIGESLLYVLRERLGLAGAKDGCSQGECGACNVQVDGRLVASCLVPAVTAAGSEVRTVEGLAEDGQPSDVQRALARCGAVQCGFCVPGMAMTVHDLLEGNPAPTELETRQALCGNLCRCSGYRGVVDAVQEVVAEREAHSAPADGDTDEARIPHQAGPGAGGVHASAFGSPPEPQTPDPHDQPYGQDGGPA